MNKQMRSKLSILARLARLGPFQRMAILLTVVTSIFLGRHFNSKVIKEMIKNPSVIGEIAPFSEKTSQMILLPLTALSLKKRLEGANQSPIKVLEIGAGAGHVTHNILKEMGNYPGVKYKFDVVEMTEEFKSSLDYTLNQAPRNVEFQLFMNDFLKFSGSGYDIIISTLPEQTIPSHVNYELIEKMKSCLNPKGVLSRVRYVLRKKWLRMFFKKDVVDDVMATDHLQRDLTSRNLTQKHLVVDNLPPVYVYHTTV